MGSGGELVQNDWDHQHLPGFFFLFFSGGGGGGIL